MNLNFLASGIDSHVEEVNSRLQIQHYDNANMILRRTLHRMRKDETFPSQPIQVDVVHNDIPSIHADFSRLERKVRSGRCMKRRKQNTEKKEAVATSHYYPRLTDSKPFPFFNLPRELRDQIYSSLVVCSAPDPVLNGSTIIKERKRQVAAQAVRHRLDQKRAASGKPPCRPRKAVPTSVIDLSILRACHQATDEASNIFYSNNWFAITLSHLPTTTAETPQGWDLSRIKRLQIELQLKDAARMNRYVDWTDFFSAYSSLRFLRIVPTFHSRYYDWAHTELQSWETAHYVHKAFFKDLLTAIPDHVDLQLGPSPISPDDEHVQAKLISTEVWQNLKIECATKWRCCGHLGRIR